MKQHKNMTFSIPDDLVQMLHINVGKRGLSRFISEAVRKALTEKQREEEKELDAAYEAANKDADRLEALKDWDSLDDTKDLIDDEDWDWLKHD